MTPRQVELITTLLEEYLKERKEWLGIVESVLKNRGKDLMAERGFADREIGGLGPIDDWRRNYDRTVIQIAEGEETLRVLKQ